MKCLVLGGTRDALILTENILRLGHEVIYSIAGVTRKPSLQCPIITGGFTQQGERRFDNGVIGLRAFIEKNNIECLIDATHPYALQISSHAVQAAMPLSIPVLRYNRPAWEKTSDDNWINVASVEAALDKIEAYQSVFFTIGQQIFPFVHQRKPSQDWLVRSAGVEPLNVTGINEIKNIGPFSFESEKAIFKQHGIDILVSKNSGGTAVAAKIEVARLHHLPVIMLARPQKPEATACFSSIDSLLDTINQRYAH